MSQVDDTKDIMDSGAFKSGKNDQPIQRIKVIGVGGGGNNAVIYMHKQGIKDVSFVIINTDRQDLEAADIPTKVLIGPGLGAGGVPERARKYAEESAEQIANLFDDETDMVFITAGMGGGTGTGAAPIVARIAKEKGILTVGIVTVPFHFEGERKVLKAYAGAAEMAKNVDSLLVIDNERLTEIYEDLDIFNAFAKADDTLLNATQSITDIITLHGTINRDFNDVDSTLRDGGSAIISTGYGEGPDRVTEAIKNALHSPLLNDTDVFTAKKLLMVLYVNEDSEKYPFKTGEINTLRKFVNEITKDVDVMWGLYKQGGLDDKVRISILASGFDVSTHIVPGKAVKIQNPNNEGTNTGQSGNGIKNKHPQSSSGLVLDPQKYDDPDDDLLLQIESEPALSRNPYKKYITNQGGGMHRNLSNDISIPGLGAQKENNEGAPKPTKGGVTLRFDDFK